MCVRIAVRVSFGLFYDTTRTCFAMMSFLCGVFCLAGVLCVNSQGIGEEDGMGWWIGGKGGMERGGKLGVYWMRTSDSGSDFQDVYIWWN